MTNSPISHRAMLVALNIRTWRGQAADREVAAQTEIANSAEQGTMTVLKQLTPKHLINPITQVKRLGRDTHYRFTVPGLFKGQALLATKMFETYMMAQQDIKEQFDQAVEKFTAVYPSIRDEAKSKLGASYKDSDFPSVSEIKSYFDYSVQVGPVPEVNDWRLSGIDQSEVESLRSDVEDSVKHMYEDATREVYDRARGILESIVRQAKNYNIKAPGAMLRDPTIETLKEVSELVCMMNITGDPLLDKIGKDMVREFSDIQPTELRRSADMRKDIASKATAILGKMSTIKRVAA